MDDLARILARAGPAGESDALGFHQGTIVSWDEQTGENVVRVLNKDLVDLSSLNLTETLTLAAGMHVGILRVKTQFFILGRITVPNTPSFFSGAMPDMPAAFYNVHTDDVLQHNTVGATYNPKLVGGYVVNHPIAQFGVRSQVSGGTAVGAWRVQWYTSHPGGVSNPPGGTLMASLTGIPAPGFISSRTYEWPAGMRGQLVFISYEVSLTAGVSGSDWVSAVPTHFVGRSATT